MNPMRTGSATRLPAVMRAARPRQWLKNVLVLAAPAAAGVLDQRGAIADTAIAVVAFCLASSAVYLLNDAADVEADRVHPVKQARPIPAGELTVETARSAAVVLAVAAVVVTQPVGWQLAGVTVAYLAVGAGYTTVVKQVPFLELAVVASGFWLRAYAGAVAVDVAISPSFGLVVAAGAAFTVSGKRVAETHALGPATITRPVLARYRPPVLAAVQAVAGLTTMVGYVVWVAADRPAGVSGLPAALAALPLGIALVRYWRLTRSGRGEEPEEVLLHDRVALASAVAWAGLYALAVYG